MKSSNLQEMFYFNAVSNIKLEKLMHTWLGFTFFFLLFLDAYTINKFGTLDYPMKII